MEARTTVMVEELPAAIALGLRVAETPGSLVTADNVIVPGEPTAVVLMVLVGLGPPSCMLRALGLAEIVKSCSRPTPCSGTICDPPATLPLKVSCPLLSPGADGENVTNTKQLAPAASGFGALGQSVLEMAKSPVVDGVVTSGPLPELVT